MSLSEHVYPTCEAHKVGPLPVYPNPSPFLLLIAQLIMGLLRSVLLHISTPVFLPPSLACLHGLLFSSSVGVHLSLSSLPSTTWFPPGVSRAVKYVNEFLAPALCTQVTDACFWHCLSLQASTFSVHGF